MNGKNPDKTPKSPAFPREEGPLSSILDLHAVLEGMPIAAVILDKQLRVHMANRAFEALTGYAEERICGLLGYYVFRSSFHRYDWPVASALSDGSSCKDEGDIINLSRQRVPVRLHAHPLPNSEGETVAVLAVLEDLSRDESLPAQDSIEMSGAEIIGHSPSMLKVLKSLPILAQTDSTVLVTGETGTGKDLIAAVIHKLSTRNAGAYVKVNCGALPENLMESELFGHKRGAFTGADRDKPGRFQLADGGTLYLTEIGDLPLALQVKLLTVLDDREVSPLGGTRNISTDVRLITATHRDLEFMTNKGLFRRDLLYRLKVIRIDLPPLRERGDDVLLLASHFLIRFKNKLGKDIKGFSDKAEFHLRNYQYPGNVRELMNIIEYAVSICDGSRIEIGDLPDYLKEERQTVDISEEIPERDKTLATDALPPIPHGNNENLDWQQIERRMIAEALIATRGNRAKAAAKLGWARATLWRKMKKHGLQ